MRVTGSDPNTTSLGAWYSIAGREGDYLRMLVAGEGSDEDLAKGGAARSAAGRRRTEKKTTKEGAPYTVAHTHTGSWISTVSHGPPWPSSA